MYDGIPFWKEAPFFRVTLPFIAGIWIQRLTSGPLWAAVVVMGGSAVLLVLISFFPLRFSFSFFRVQGSCINLLLLSAGYALANVKSPFKARDDLEASPYIEPLFVVTLEEPLQEKSSTWKSVASLDGVIQQGAMKIAESRVLIYFRKNGPHPPPVWYGTRVAFKKDLARIKNNTTGGFDFVEYCALKNIHHQVFLERGEYSIIQEGRGSRLISFVFRSQHAIVAHLKKYIRGVQEAGLALALLIGYKNELDRSLVQAYSNTGVVHVIAISGLHLGIIYVLLRFLCRPLLQFRSGKLISSVVVSAGLWLFTLLAGAGASIVRSAVMFTCLAIGEAAGRRTPLINNLAASAFILLCYDPFWLWDLGFLLSYSALVGIALYAQPLYSWVHVNNRLAEELWKINSVTIAAQVLTAPIIMYSFHQFPNLFLVTNFIAVPASTIILIGEILLCAFWLQPVICSVIGYVLVHLIRWMNSFIVCVNKLSFASTRDVDMSTAQVVLLYVFISCLSVFISLKNKRLLYLSVVVLIAFFACDLYKIWQ